MVVFTVYTVHHSYSDEEKAVEFQKKLNVCEMVIVHTYLTVVSGFLKRDKELNVLLESLKILHMGKKDSMMIVAECMG